MPTPSTDMIELAAGHDEPIRLARRKSQRSFECRGPQGICDAAAVDRALQAVRQPQAGPPLAAHVVDGDRIVVAVAADVPQNQAILQSVVSTLAEAGATDDRIEVLRLWSNRLQPVVAGATTVIFDPSNEADTCYLMADDEANPLYVARALVDADVVVSVGSFGWNAALCGRATEGELWPSFSRAAAAEQLKRTLALSPRGGHQAWKTTAHDVLWQIGVIAEVRAVSGVGDSLADVSFGMPHEVVRTARRAARDWSPRLSQAAEITVASLADPHAGLDTVVRAIAAASRVTYPDGTVCVASRLSEQPGVVFTRWRQGVEVEPLVREAVRSGDPALIADAYLTRQIARNLGSRRLVLASDLDGAAVESLDIGHAATAEDVERLCHTAESLNVLHEADRMLPRLA
jgi:hypothetical protein